MAINRFPFSDFILVTHVFLNRNTKVTNKVINNYGSRVSSIKNEFPAEDSFIVMLRE